MQLVILKGRWPFIVHKKMKICGPWIDGSPTFEMLLHAIQIRQLYIGIGTIKGNQHVFMKTFFRIGNLVFGFGYAWWNE